MALCFNRAVTTTGGVSMARLLISYHSQSGSCARLARAARDGANREEGAMVAVLRAWDTGSSDLRRADGLLLVAAENSGALSGGAKDLLDRVFYPSIDHGLVLPYTLILSAGNDGRGAARQVKTILSGIPFPPAAEPVICRGPVNDRHLSDCAELGQGFAAGLGMGIY
jgi:multimeric flavodoxin WrbA